VQRAEKGTQGVEKRARKGRKVERKERGRRRGGHRYTLYEDGRFYIGVSPTSVTQPRALATVTLTRSESRSLSRRVLSLRSAIRAIRDGTVGRRNVDRTDFCPINMHRVAGPFADVISTWRGPISRDITINAI